jgi:hypothetical protein
VRRQRAHAHAAADGGRQRPGDLEAIQAEDEDVNALLRLLDGGDNWGDTRVRLNDQFHNVSDSVTIQAQDPEPWCITSRHASKLMAISAAYLISAAGLAGPPCF